MGKMLVIGIAGGTSCGKSTITDIIEKEFGGLVSVMRHDDYYKEQHNLPLEIRAKQNYDCPEAYDTDLMVEHLSALKNGFAVECPVYDYTVHDRGDATRRIEPTAVLVVDGILILSDARLRGLMDIKIFVDTDADIRVLRRIVRDMNERNRTLDSIISQYLTTVKPMHEAFVEPSKKYADIIIPEGGRNRVAMEMLINRIKSHFDKG